jgi:hypothetical protein
MPLYQAVDSVGKTLATSYIRAQKKTDEYSREDNLPSFFHVQLYSKSWGRSEGEKHRSRITLTVLGLCIASQLS